MGGRQAVAPYGMTAAGTIEHRQPARQPDSDQRLGLRVDGRTPPQVAFGVEAKFARLRRLRNHPQGQRGGAKGNGQAAEPRCTGLGRDGSSHQQRNGAATRCRETQPAAPFKRGRTGDPAETVAGHQTRRNTSVPLVPPKPKEFLIATLIGSCRAVLAQ